VTIPFPLWKQPEKLTGALIDLLLRFPEQGPIAVTMTGELCDCFENRASGVKHILQAVQEAARDRPLYIWRHDAKWASVNHALEDPGPVASANWLAAATFTGRYRREGQAWFFDLGSTTLDIIPLDKGVPVPRGRSDLERLKAGELAYLGVSRTPLCAIAGQLSINDSTPVTTAAEFFATIDDVYLTLGSVAEDPNDRNTADGRPRTKEHAQARLARMVCSSLDEIVEDEVNALADKIRLIHEDKLLKAIHTAHERHGRTDQEPWGGVILAGSGEWLLTELIACYGAQAGPIVSVSAQHGSEISAAVCAYAVAALLAERLTK
jgi:probable H4MPT-linked C1 transfer pathway protein